MSLVVTVPPAAFISAAEAKAALRIYHDDDDAFIDTLIAAATYHLDGDDGVLGRALASQTLVLTLDGFPCDRLHIPVSPTISVTSITYDNAAGVSTPLVGFRTMHAAAQTGTYLLPALNGAWPDTNGEPGAVRVTFVAGHSTVPPTIRHAILLLVGHWYEHREAALDTGAKFGLLELPLGVQRLLAQHVFRHPIS